MKKLIRWDIDGTLLKSGGASRRALEYSINRIFSIEVTLDDIDFNGRTDLSIFKQFFIKYDLDNNKENILRLSELYFRRLIVELTKSEGTLCPGIPEILERTPGLSKTLRRRKYSDSTALMSFKGIGFISEL